MSIFEKLKRFYKKSPENRLEIFNILAFIVFPLIGLLAILIVVLYLYGSS